MKILALVFSLVPILPVIGFADVPAPRPQGQPIHMRIAKTSVGAGGPVLEIPAKLFTNHAALFDLRPPIVPSSSSGLVIAGMLLAAAIYFLGRWIWNRRLKKNDSAGKTVGHLLLAALLFFGAGALVRNASADAPDNLNDAVGENGTLEGTVTVQIRADGNDVVLHLTPPRHPVWRQPAPQPRR